MSIDLTPTRQNMLENIIKFLNDDCYVYIMTTGLDGYNKSLETCDFYTFNFGLSAPFHEKITNLYKAIDFENPTNIVNEMYFKCVSNALTRIQEENHPFSIGINIKSVNLYDIVFLKKKGADSIPAKQ